MIFTIESQSGNEHTLSIEDVQFDYNECIIDYKLYLVQSYKYNKQGIYNNYKFKYRLIKKPQYINIQNIISDNYEQYEKECIENVQDY